MSLAGIGCGRKHINGHKRVKLSNRRKNGRKCIRGGDDSVASNAGTFGVNATIPGIEGIDGMGNGIRDFLTKMTGGGLMGGHRCPSRHRRSKRTRKAHAGRKSRKNKSRGKKHGMSLRSIFGRS